MRQAIRTRYLAPTNTVGARIKAECSAKSKIYGWDHSLGPIGNHSLAAEKLMRDCGWHELNYTEGGSLVDGSYIWVQLPRKPLSLQEGGYV
jgi:hypothetical protein